MSNNDMIPAIQVEGLHKTFRIGKRSKSIVGRFFRYFAPEYETLHAVKDISFNIMKGERIAFIGPNGAGKSTTIKLITGIFEPTLGTIRIYGKNPYQKRKEVSSQIGVVFGQRSQLWYHLPAYDSFRLLSAIYDIPKSIFHNRLEELVDLFELTSLLQRCVKELSLGERMRCELIASLLHDPQILFLDEPTIGLDIISKNAIRQFINKRTKERGTTVFLTSHDIADIERVCSRILLINRGIIVLDDSVPSIKAKHFTNKRMIIRSSQTLNWEEHPYIELVPGEINMHSFHVDITKMDVESVIRYLSKKINFTDITIEDLPLEEILRGIYQS